MEFILQSIFMVFLLPLKPFFTRKLVKSTLKSLNNYPSEWKIDTKSLRAFHQLSGVKLELLELQFQWFYIYKFEVKDGVYSEDVSSSLRLIEKFFLNYQLSRTIRATIRKQNKVCGNNGKVYRNEKDRILSENIIKNKQDHPEDFI